MTLLKPRLYTAEDGEPALHGGSCTQCQHIFFPFQHFGCERCGSQDLEPYKLKAQGKLKASAVVHLHPGDRRPTPFTVGAVELEEGPSVRTLLEVPADASLGPGVRVTAIFVETPGDDGFPRLDIRFLPECGR